MEMILMKINLSKKEIQPYIETKNTNIDIASFYQFFLNERYDWITEELVEGWSKDSKNPYYELLLDACEIDANDPLTIEQNKLYEIDKIIELDEKEYLSNPYFLHIKPVEIKNKRWSLQYNYYAPYEGMIYKSIDIDPKENYIERTRLAYFKNQFPYLVLLEGNVVWMSITPHEINTMKESIEEAYGDVLVYGLGLGYYAYMCSLKDSVKSVTIVEADDSVITLFKQYILPQFEHKDKITIIKQDAIIHSKESNKKYDYTFADIWKDQEDGLPLYIKLKQNEKHGKYSYWIEESFLILIRRSILVLIEEQLLGKTKKDYLKANNLFDKIINQLYFMLENHSIDTKEDLDILLSDNNIKQLILKIKI